MARKKTDKPTAPQHDDAPAPEFLLGSLAVSEPKPVQPAATEAPAAISRSHSDRKAASTPAPLGAAQASSPAPGGYTVLARRYRSREFDELVGQEPIAQTLKNAIAAGRTAHAYLFCGTRGVGKTSMARIFAKALNVTDDLQQKDQIAQAIMRGDDLDVIEIDGASNRGVDQARDLIANAGMSPARSRYKIYIIDEVHMLTKEAFNTLLKTMEEPPAHVKFILCTTEPHKVPATIQSRCQRFDFRAIPTARIAQQIRDILAKEGVTAEDEAVAQVARMGRGSMRDALSILDCVLASGERRMTAAQVAQTLGLPEHALLTQIVDAVVAADPPSALKAGAELLARGASVEQAMESLLEHLRDLMVAAACGSESELLELSGESRQQVGEQASHFDPPGLVYLISLCEAVARQARGSSAARAMFDAVLVRMCVAEHLASIPSLLGRDGAAAAGGAVDEKKKPAPWGAPGDLTATQRPGIQMAELKPQADFPARGGVADERAGHQPDAAALDPAHWWEQVRAAAASDADRAKLAHLLPQSLDGRTVRLTISEGAASMAGWLRTQGAWVGALIKRATGRNVQVEFVAGDAGSPQDHVPHERIVEEALRLPTVVRAMAALDAGVVDVRIAEPPRGHRIEAPEEAIGHV